MTLRPSDVRNVRRLLIRGANRLNLGQLLRAEIVDRG
jgi:hypothetical protein